MTARIQDNTPASVDPQENHSGAAPRENAGFLNHGIKALEEKCAILKELMKTPQYSLLESLGENNSIEHGTGDPILSGMAKAIRNTVAYADDQASIAYGAASRHADIAYATGGLIKVLNSTIHRMDYSERKDLLQNIADAFAPYYDRMNPLKTERGAAIGR